MSLNLQWVDLQLKNKQSIKVVVFTFSWRDHRTWVKIFILPVETEQNEIIKKSNMSANPHTVRSIVQSSQLMIHAFDFSILTFVRCDL